VSWTLYRWTWRLEAPLFVGAPPAGSLNRCRLYVPSRALWGGLTAELARRRENTFPNYEAEGTTLHENTRFTYLFPAECDGKHWRAWLPRYEERDGLVWRREDRQDTEERPLTDRQMRRRLLDTRPSTAINPDSDSAEEGSLRETECVLPQWRDIESPVAFVGYVFLKQDWPELWDVTVLFLGGDTRYGLGRLQRVKCTPASKVFGEQVDLNQEPPTVRTDRLLAHTCACASTPEIMGTRELLAGWDRTKDNPFSALSNTALWTPGSRTRCSARTQEWSIGDNGVWKSARGQT
jgi:hypothetical protein